MNTTKNKGTVRTNMKYAKRIVFVIAILIAVYFYAIVDNTEILYNKDASTSDYVNTGVVYDGTLEQTVSTAENVLDGISIKCGLAGESSRVTVYYRLLDEKGDVVGEGEKSAADIKDKKFCKLGFSQIKESQGKSYTLVIDETGADEDNGVNFYVDPSTTDKTVTVQGEEIDGSLVAKTVSHRFDGKTYVLTICFVIYLIAFVKFLNNLFK